MDSEKREYIVLLDKFCNNKDLQNLLNKVIIDDIRETENIYLTTGKYPDKRNLFSKLISDLSTRKETMIKKEDKIEI